MSKLLKELKTKLAEKEEYIELLLEEKAGYLDLISGYADKCKQLKQQLEEKDKLLMQKIGNMKSTDFIRMCVDCGLMIRAYTTKEDNNANNRKTQNPTSKM